MRALVLLLAFAAATPVTDVFTTVASALSEGNAITFMRPFDAAMPGVDSLRANVTALLAQADVLCSIEFLSDEGDDTHRTVKMDWLLQIRAKQEGGPLVRRTQAVTCRVERRGKKWAITSFEPLDLLAPPPPAR